MLRTSVFPKQMEGLPVTRHLCLSPGLLGLTNHSGFVWAQKLLSAMFGGPPGSTWWGLGGAGEPVVLSLALLLGMFSATFAFLKCGTQNLLFKTMFLNVDSEISNFSALILAN